jgi:hypothetical protein
MLWKKWQGRAGWGAHTLAAGLLWQKPYLNSGDPARERKRSAGGGKGGRSGRREGWKAGRREGGKAGRIGKATGKAATRNITILSLAFVEP